MILRQFRAVLEKNIFSPKKCHVIHLGMGQHDVLCDPNHVCCDPHTVSWPTQLVVWHGGLVRPGSAGVVC